VKWIVLCCCAATAVSLGAAAPPHGNAAGCARGSVRAVIGGKRACLKAGQRCKKALDRQYHRYKFHCHSGKLTRARPPVPLTPFSFELQPVNDSGVTGTVTMTPLGALKTRVVIEIRNPPAGSLPAHIHFGKCPDPAGIFYGLPNVIDGRSETEVGAIAPLRRSAFSVNVHRDEPDLPYLACGDIPPA
jgi:hypothetical protein